MNHKQLHKHSLPIILLTVGLAFISIFGLTHLIVPSQNSDTLSGLISERFFNIQPARDGLFHMSRYQDVNNSDNSAVESGVRSTGLSAINTTGETAELTVALNLGSQPAQ